MNNYKYLISVYFIIICINFSFGQIQALPYQTVLTDFQGAILNNIDVEIKIDLIAEAEDGMIVYSENHQITSGSGGEISLAVGSGEATSVPFESVDWSKPNFIEVSFKPDGFTTFFSNGVTQLLSVPYALFVLRVSCEEGCPGNMGITGKDGEDGPQGPMGPQGSTGPHGQEGDKGMMGLSGIETLEPTNEIPASPVVGQLYLDNGMNRIDGNIGFRYFDGSNWLDI